MILDDQPGVLLEEGVDQPPDPRRGTHAGHVLHAQDDVPRAAAQRHDLLQHPEVVGVRALGGLGEGDGGREDLPPAQHLLGHRRHVGDVVQEVEAAPHVDRGEERPDRQPHDVARVHPVPPDVRRPDEGLGQDVRHPLGKKARLLERVDHVVHQVLVEPCAAVDLDGEVARGVVDRHQAGQVVEGEPVLEVALAGVARPRVRQPDRLAVPEGFQDLPVPFLLQGPEHHPPVSRCGRCGRVRKPRRRNGTPCRSAPRPLRIR
ncbi:MAG: hypothetical protein H6Q79_2914 [Deltaproteobacteria bacterium]|nr:hypothetical protein [Deltaproteobacteria bacterium]